MQLGNNIEFTRDFDKAKRLFKINSIEAFIECISVLADNVRNKKRTHVQFLSEDKFKMADIRSAYWCWMKSQYTSAQHDGTSIEDLHKRYKATYLLSILCAKDSDFADMILLVNESDFGSEKKEQQVNKILSIADGSVTGYKEMSAYFNACKENEQYN